MKKPYQPTNETSTSANAPTGRRKNRFVFIAIVMLIASGLVLGVISNSVVRLTRPSQPDGETSLPATQPTARHQDPARGVVADGSSDVTTTAPVPGSPAAGSDGNEAKLLPNPPAPRPGSARGLDSGTAPIESRRSAIAKARDNTLEQTVDERPAAFSRTAEVPNVFAAPGSQKPRKNESQEKSAGGPEKPQELDTTRKPREGRLTKARPFNGDVRNLPRRKPVEREKPERPDPHVSRGSRQARRPHLRCRKSAH